MIYNRNKKNINNINLINNTNKIIRLIDENGNQIGLINFNQAVEEAKKKNLDLILLNSVSTPNVYKIADYNKHIYKKNKNYKNIKSNKINIKEIKIRFNIQEYDLNIKINKIILFLSKKYKVKLTLIFKGREIIHRSIGINIINKIYDNCKNISIKEKDSYKIENRQITLFLIPIKK